VTGATIVQALLSFFILSLAGFHLAHEIWTGQRPIAAERERLAGLVTRLDVARVPEWLYRLQRDTDERDLADAANGIDADRQLERSASDYRDAQQQ
jgi:hypothetical protein